MGFSRMPDYLARCQFLPGTVGTLCAGPVPDFTVSKQSRPLSNRRAGMLQAAIASHRELNAGWSHREATLDTTQHSCQLQGGLQSYEEQGH